MEANPNGTRVVDLLEEGVQFFDTNIYRIIADFGCGKARTSDVLKVLSADCDLPESGITHTLAAYKGGAWHEMTCAAESLIALLLKSGKPEFEDLDCLEKLGTRWLNFNMKERE